MIPARDRPWSASEAALSLFQERTGWDSDLSDALSFAFMKDASLDRVVTYDTDFAKPGFSIVD